MNFQDRSSRWVPDKVGFVNFWVYVNEEFPFGSGKILFRGRNGHGKSVSMQSIVPMLLDGDISPARIDSFGSKKKKIIDYLKVDDEVEKGRIAYVYITYKKDETNEVITTGIGLRAVNETKVDFWGFVIKGLEINNGFNLTKSAGYNTLGREEFVTISKDELMKKIEELGCGKVLDSAKEYADEVNKHIFKYGENAQLRELTNLLIQVRSPKLSKDVSPKNLHEALRNSLGELPATSFSMISNTIKDIDDRNRKVEKTETDLALAEGLSREYGTYLLNTLGNTAYRYLEASEEKQNASRRLKKKDIELLELIADVARLNEELNDVDIELYTKRTQLDLMESSEIRGFRNERDKKQEEKSDKEEELVNKTNQREVLEDNILNLKYQINQLELKCYEIEKETSELVRDSKDIAEEVQFREHDSYQLLLNENLLHYEMDKTYFESWNKRIKDHSKKLNNVLYALKEEQRIQELLKNKKEEIREVESGIEEETKIIKELEKDSEFEKNEYRLRLSSWNGGNQELHLEEENIAEIVYTVENLFDFEDMKPAKIEQEMTVIKDALLEKMNEKIYEIRASVKSIEEKLIELKEKKEELEKQVEVQPSFRRLSTILERQHLKAIGVPFVSFYETIEFKEEVVEESKERIESALIDMGILDSLIVPKEFIEMVGMNDSVFVPTAIQPKGNTLASVVKVIVPENNAVNEEDILAVLTNISLEKVETETYVTVAGEYRHGLVKGIAVLNEQTSFIGEEARRRHRESIIQEFVNQLDELAKTLNILRKAKAELENRKILLLLEFNGRPSLDEMVRLHEKMNRVLYRKEELEKKKDKLFIAHDDLTTTYSQKRIARAEVSVFLDGVKDIDTIENMLDVVESEYLEKVQRLTNLMHQFESKKNQYENNQDNLTNTEDIANELQGEINSLTSQIKTLTVNIDGINKILKEMNAEEKEKEIEETRSRIKELDKIRDYKIKEIPTVEAKLGRVKEDVSKFTNEMAFTEEYFEVRKEMFNLDLRLKGIETTSNLDELAAKYANEKVNVIEALQQMHDVVSDIRAIGLEDYALTSQDVSSGNASIKVNDYPHKKDKIEIIYNEKKRKNISLFVQGSKMNPTEFFDYLKELKVQQDAYLKEEEAELIKNVMIQGVGEKIRKLVEKATVWKDDINRFMKQLNSSVEIRLMWSPIEEKDTSYSLSTKKLVDLLGRDFDTLKEIDVDALSKHFMTKINIAKEKLNSNQTEEEVRNLEEALRQVLDYRDWYKFKIMYKLEGEDEKELTPTRMNLLSGGEKAMAIYIPLFSAAYSKYSTAAPDAPYLIALDEAFAGVDEDNISEMFGLMEQLGFDYILTSQALWGDYPTVSNINIFELNFDKVARFVSAEPWKWDGKKMTLNEEILSSKGLYLDENDEFMEEITHDELQFEFVFDSIRSEE
ncbi:TIGR02680 family protein [Psychrobacillus sp. NPDC058041]|uniref:TIGR02680 family protein n=1 Tax=Psychrobacillus sp. NPDC058041 TaxID=3346310 RepID=UPI0036DD4F5A